jgi:superfamily II DNA/RNA helicase
MENQLSPLHLKILSNLNLTSFNPMQLEVIDECRSLENLLVLSPTGSGKTLAFLSVVLEKLSTLEKGVNALIVVPSRELALQVESVFRSMKTNLKVTCCYGGHDFKVEESSLSEAPAVLIGTPGRILDHMSRNTLDLSTVGMVILDEYDKLLQMGFEEEISDIFKVFKKKPQLVLTSATEIDTSKSFIRSKKFKTIDHRNQAESKLKLFIVRTHSTEKVEALFNLIRSFNQEPTLVFCNHRDAVDRISEHLTSNRFSHVIFHGGLEQIDREKNLIKFRCGASNVLLATDLAARGLDIPLIKHVVNFQTPPKEDEFAHRNGRTARMHANGSAYVIVSNNEELPFYISEDTKEYKAKEGTGGNKEPDFACFYISAGKKDKISRGDILGFLTQACGIKGEDIGLISILDKASYVAVKRNLITPLLRASKGAKIKKLRVKMELAS